MTIAILINGESALKQAGTRIRYKRLADLNGRTDKNIMIVTSIDKLLEIEDLSTLIIGKVVNSLAIIAASIFSKKNIPIGIDIFDDYFSNNMLITSYQRYWLSSIEKYNHFYLCSTKRMKNVLDSLTCKPIYILEDPISKSLSLEKLKILLQNKQKSLLKSSVLNITWFGIGDNPIFPVGIEDLHAWFNSLREIKSTGREIHLNVLTNKRALTTNRLLLLSQCPVPLTLIEWNEELEKEVLEMTDIAFLPVNFQKFSIAKSPNRALTALIHGCQVLSPGYDLYQELHDFIYTSTELLVCDINQKSFVFNSSNLNDFIDKIISRFDPKIGRLLLQEISNIHFSLCSKNPVANVTQNLLILIAGIDPFHYGESLEQIDSTVTAALPYKNNDNEVYDIYFSQRTSGCYLRIRKSLPCVLPKLSGPMSEVTLLPGDEDFASFHIYDLERAGILTPLELNIIEISFSLDDFHLHVFNYSTLLTLMSKIIRLLFSRFNIILNEKPGSYWLGQVDGF